MENINIDFIYVAHYDKLTNRKEYLLHEFNKYNIKNFSFFSNYSRDNIDLHELKNFNHELKNYIKRDITSSELPYVCNFANHFTIYLDIIKNNYKKVLIIEDDAILCENFTTIFNNYLNQLPHDWDMTFLHNGCDMHAPNITPDILWYKVPSTRTVCSYMITLETAKKFVQNLLPIDKHKYFNIDHVLNEIIDSLHLQVYWCEPVIICEGSENNNYNSSVIRIN